MPEHKLSEIDAALVTSVLAGETAQLESLHLKGANFALGADGNYIQTLLHIASRLGHCGKMLELLVAKGAPLEIRNYRGDTPLHRAARHGVAECVRQLARLGANVNPSGRDGFTALHDAAFWGHLETVRALISLRANISTQAYEGGFTPIESALWPMRSDNRLEIVNLFVEAGALNRQQYALYRFDLLCNSELLQTLLQTQRTVSCFHYPDVKGLMSIKDYERLLDSAKSAEYHDDLTSSSRSSHSVQDVSHDLLSTSLASYGVGFIAGFAGSLCDEVYAGSGKYASSLSVLAAMYASDRSVATLLVFSGFEYLMCFLGLPKQHAHTVSWTLVLALSLMDNDPIMILGDIIIGLLANNLGSYSGRAVAMRTSQMYGRFFGTRDEVGLIAQTLCARDIETKTC